jgi:putative ABC transport system permease protein
VAAIEGVDDVVGVTAFRRESVTLDGEPSLLSTADTGALVEIAGIDVKEGSFDDLVPGTVAVVDPDALDGDAASIEVGSTVTIAGSAGDTADLEVVAILDATIDVTLVGNLVDTETFDDLVGDTAPTAAFIDVESGAQTDAADDIDTLVARRPDITVSQGNELAELIGGVFDFLINAVNGLLLMSVVVALIGIVNTLSLSILERRRELGLLRIVGMTDKRVQRMVRLESALIAALGTVTGMALGLVVGWGLVLSIDRLSDAGLGFALPASLLALILVLGVLLGFLASLIPARRSTRLEVLDAIQAT